MRGGEVWGPLRPLIKFKLVLCVHSGKGGNTLPAYQGSRLLMAGWRPTLGLQEFISESLAPFKRGYRTPAHTEATVIISHPV